MFDRHSLAWPFLHELSMLLWSGFKQHCGQNLRQSFRESNTIRKDVRCICISVSFLFLSPRHCPVPSLHRHLNLRTSAYDT